MIVKNGILDIKATYRAKVQFLAKIILKINSEKDETEVIVEVFFKTIQLSLENREDVFLRGFDIPPELGGQYQRYIHVTP